MSGTSVSFTDLLGTRNTRPIRRRSRARVAFVVLALLAIAGWTGASTAWSAVGGDATLPEGAYDTTDPRLVLGEAAFVVVATVDHKLGRTPFLGGRIAYEVVVREELKGSVPTRLKVAQRGHALGPLFTGYADFPLMRQGETFVMALGPPAPRDDALVVLDGPAGGNLLPVDTRTGGGVEEARALLQQARYPDELADGRDAAVRRVQRFTRTNPGFSSPGPTALP